MAKVRTALRNCTGLDDDGFDAVTEEISIESHHGGEVILLETTLSRAREVRGALGLLSDGNRAQLESELDPRTDDDGVFHFRLSKQDALAHNIRVTKGDDAVKCQLKPEVHPTGRAKAMAAITDWLANTD